MLPTSSSEDFRRVYPGRDHNWQLPPDQLLERLSVGLVPVGSNVLPSEVSLLPLGQAQTGSTNSVIFLVATSCPLRPGQARRKRKRYKRSRNKQIISKVSTIELAALTTGDAAANHYQSERVASVLVKSCPASPTCFQLAQTLCQKSLCPHQDVERKYESF